MFHDNSVFSVVVVASRVHVYIHSKVINNKLLKNKLSNVVMSKND